MNVSFANPATAAYPTGPQGGLQQPALDFKALGSALRSGDLSAAQQAFANLQKDAQSPVPLATTSTSKPTSQNSPLAGDLQALQSALQSGDLSGAQSAFATLRQDLQSSSGVHRAHHHRHPGGIGTSNNPNPVSAPASAGVSTASAASALLNAQA